MRLELALTSSCSDSGCQVKLLGGDEVIATRYSDLVRDRIQIRPQQLVAIDMSLPIPEIVWRWIRAIVLEVNDNSVGIEDDLGHVLFVSKVATLPLMLSVGDQVWCCNTDKDHEVHDRIVDGEPADPHQLLEYITPIIERIYSIENE